MFSLPLILFKLFVYKVNPHPFLIENRGTDVNCRLMSVGQDQNMHYHQAMLHPFVLNFAFRLEKAHFVV